MMFDVVQQEKYGEEEKLMKFISTESNFYICWQTLTLP
jgi:hypothetical protein